MPEGFPTPKGLTEREVAENDQICELIHGPVVGAYTPRIVSRGSHPQEVKDAWVGIRMPVRRDAASSIGYGSEKVDIDASEAFNALVAAEAPEAVLRYWINLLPGDIGTTLGFSLREGDFEYFEPGTPEEVDKVAY